MRELVFALEFRGKAGPVPGVEGAREANTTASTDRLATYIGGDWLRARMDAIAGEPATLQARVQRFEDGTFVEEGTIVYGPAARSRSRRSAAAGSSMAPRPARWSAPSCGASWRGRAASSAAQGLITSNFTVNDDGDVVDHHFARIYLP